MNKINFVNNSEPALSAENLNEMQDNMEEVGVAVSPTEPTTNEKVWIQKGKNLFKDSLVNALGNTEYNNGTVIQKTADTNQNPNWKLTGYNNYDYVEAITSFTPSLGRNGLTFVKKSNFNNLQLGVNGSSIDTVIHINVADLKNEETYTISFNVLNKTQGSISWKDIQIERGSTATEYEEYIDKKIYCRNDNGVFEEFINAENEDILYKNPKGTQDTIRLNRGMMNYKYIEIFFGFFSSDGSSYESSIKIYNPTRKYATLSILQLSSNTEYYINNYMCEIYLWYNEISFEKPRNISFTTTGIKEISATNYIKITQIVGHN